MKTALIEEVGSERFSEAVQYLLNRGMTPRDENIEEPVDKVRRFLHLVGNPQRSFRTIHVAGTSGKGSVCYLLTALLRAHGFCVGTQMSPHLYDIRERLLLNGEFISPRQFADLVAGVRPLLDKTTPGKALSMYQPVFAMACQLFAAEQVDYAVVEAFMGGRYDATNQFQQDQTLAIITKVGLDHTKSLGPTLSDIAAHKAGIIPLNGKAVISASHPNALVPILHAAAGRRADVRLADRSLLQNVRSVPHGAEVVYEGGVNIPLMIPTRHNPENVVTAICALELLAQRDGWNVRPELVRNVIATLIIPGRYEHRVVQGQEWWFDAAHNPQKMAHLMDFLKSRDSKQKVFLVAFKRGKDVRRMLAQIAPHASAIVATEIFTDYPDLKDRVVPAGEVANLARQIGIAEVLAEPDPNEAVAKALQLADTRQPIVATGSLYLLAEVSAALQQRESVRSR